ncbi:MAG: hypothetical protein IPK28_10600 [Devosia sp.]|nr:hypothetical protein [Devosia sp.]
MSTSGCWSFGASSGIERIDGTKALGTVRLVGDWNANVLDFRTTSLVGTNIVIDGGHGGDTIYGSAEANTIVGGGGNDVLNGGDGGDTYRVTGNQAGGWSSFQDYDTYADTGASGIDTIAALGVGNVDIGLVSFGASSGIERIDGTGTLGTVRLVGDWSANLLDFRTTSLSHQHRHRRCRRRRHALRFGRSQHHCRRHGSRPAWMAAMAATPIGSPATRPAAGRASPISTPMPIPAPAARTRSGPSATRSTSASPASDPTSGIEG